MKEEIEDKVPRGRPFDSVKLNRPLIKRFANCIRKGMTIKASCKKCEICPNSYYLWFKRGEVNENGLYREFNAAAREAAKEYAEAHLEGIKEYEEGKKDQCMEPQRYNLDNLSHRATM